MNFIRPAGETTTIVDTAYDYNKPFVFVNGSSTQNAEVFCNIPTLGAGFVCSFAYLATAGGAEEFTVRASSNNNVVLATLKHNQVVTVTITRDCDTWYSTQDCVDCVVGDFDACLSFVALKKAPVEAAVEAPVEVPVEAVVGVVEAPVEVPVEAPVEVPVEAPVEVPVEAVVEAPVVEVKHAHHGKKALCSDSCDCADSDSSE